MAEKSYLNTNLDANPTAQTQAPLYYTDQQMAQMLKPPPDPLSQIAGPANMQSILPQLYAQQANQADQPQGYRRGGTVASLHVNADMPNFAHLAKGGQVAPGADVTEDEEGHPIGGGGGAGAPMDYGNAADLHANDLVDAYHANAGRGTLGTAGGVGKNIADGGAIRKVVYHGGDSDLSNLNMNPRQVGGEVNWGLHLGTPEQANSRIQDMGLSVDGGRVTPMEMSIKNPLRVDDLNDSWHPEDVRKHLAEKYPEEFGHLGKGEAEQWATLPADEEAAKVLGAIRNKGYDSLVYKNEAEGRGEDSYVVFDPRQVKPFYAAGGLIKNFKAGGPVEMNVPVVDDRTAIDALMKDKSILSRYNVDPQTVPPERKPAVPKPAPGQGEERDDEGFVPGHAKGGLIGPTEAQKHAGNYKKIHAHVRGIPIAIENPAGSVRSGKGADGKPWSVAMPHHYGYFKRTEGKDGDQVDVHVGPHIETDQVHVIDQVNPDTGKFDEHKVMMGFRQPHEAVHAYHSSFSDGKGHLRMGGMVSMHVDHFRKWLADKHATKRPAAKRTGGILQRFAAGGQVEPADDNYFGVVPMLKGMVQTAMVPGKTLFDGYQPTNDDALNMAMMATGAGAGALRGTGAAVAPAMAMAAPEAVDMGRRGILKAMGTAAMAAPFVKGMAAKKFLTGGADAATLAARGAPLSRDELNVLHNSMTNNYGRYFEESGEGSAAVGLRAEELNHAANSGPNYLRGYSEHGSGDMENVPKDAPIKHAPIGKPLTPEELEKLKEHLYFEENAVGHMTDDHVHSLNGAAQQGPDYLRAMIQKKVSAQPVTDAMYDEVNGHPDPDHIDDELIHPDEWERAPEEAHGGLIQNFAAGGPVMPAIKRYPSFLPGNNYVPPMPHYRDALGNTEMSATRNALQNMVR